MKKFIKTMSLFLIGTMLLCAGCNADGEGGDNTPETVAVQFFANGKRIETKIVEKGSTITSFPEVKIEETDFFGYNVEWFDENAEPIVFENITSNIKAYAIATKYQKTVQYTAQYAETAPVIDGTIDAVWDNAQKFNVVNLYTEGVGQAKGKVSVMWRENGLYFLGIMEDELVVDNDACNFWVCETATDMAADYSQNPADGRYAVCIGSNCQDVWNTGILRVPNVECKTQLTDGGWVIEVYVPRLSAGGFTENAYIGFDCSIDSYSGNTDRDSYCNWYGQGWYWSNVSALYKLQLKKD